ncbi:MAG: hypothetical protein V1744_06945 [Candidatus Altiarchaeota archaeon]
MNLFRLFNDLKKTEEFRARGKILSKLSGKQSFSEEEINEIFAYKKLEGHSNPEASKITRKAFETKDVAEKFRMLKRLNGVNTLTASTILMFQNQFRYAEINIKTWGVLKREYGFKAPDKDVRSDYSLQEYMGYLEILSSIAAEYGMNLSDIEHVINVS